MVRSFRICLRHICSTGLGVRNHRATLGDGLVVAAGWLRTGRPGERAAGSHRCQAVDDATLHGDAVPPAGAGGYQLTVATSCRRTGRVGGDFGPGLARGGLTRCEDEASVPACEQSTVVCMAAIDAIQDRRNYDLTGIIEASRFKIRNHKNFALKGYLHIAWSNHAVPQHVCEAKKALSKAGSQGVLQNPHIGLLSPE